MLEKRRKLRRTKHYVLSTQKGFTLIEVLMGISLFMLITLGIYFTFANVLEVIDRTRDRTLARSLLDREIEILRSLEYDEVGIVGGAPPGVLVQQRTETYENKEFTISAFVRNIDDSFDGTTGGAPNDTAPADYKLVELQITCSTCLNFAQMEFTTWVAPQNLETTSSNGSLFINVFDASGEPVANADIRVENTDVSPDILIVDSSNNSGTLALIDVPPSVNGYQITVTKPGYSSAQTYTIGDQANPNPIQPHATVATQDVTHISFAIDRISSLTVNTQDHFCQAVSNVSFDQVGERLIGQGPDVPNYAKNFTTDSVGKYAVSDLPWDVYHFTLTNLSYDLAGLLQAVPLEVDPDTEHSLNFVMVPATSTSLLVTVIDGGTGQPIMTAASVQLAKTGFNETKQTGEWAFGRTDWSGTQYASQDGNVDSESVPGQLTLIGGPGSYPTSTNSWLISNAIDLGTSSTTFNSITWSPTAQPPLTTLQFQIASNNDLASWVYIGPDGTPNTFYTTPGQAIGLWHDGNRYMRYKVNMNTTSVNQTPILTDVEMKFDSNCTPPAQAFWSGLGTGTYTATVVKSGFATATSSITVGSGWQEARITLTP